MKAILIVEMPKKCIDCPLVYKEDHFIYRCKVSEDQVDSNGIYCDCPLRPYQETIPIEWLLSIMRKQIIFAMESEMEGNITVQDGVIHCVSGALACQVLANVIKLWEIENEKDI